MAKGLRAIVLVGGEGTRLRPLTLTRPKPMLPVAGIAIIERKLRHLAEHGVTEAVLSLGYKPDAFLQAFPEGRVAGVRLIYAIEPSPLDTAGAVRFAADQAGYRPDDGDDSPIVVVNGDVLTEIDLTSQLAFHRSCGAEATIALTQVEDPSAFGVVPTDADQRVIDFVEKPPREQAPTDWINAGAYVLAPRVLARIPVGERVSIERATFPLIVAAGGLFAVHSPAYWIDAGIPATYLQANLDALAAGAAGVGEDARVLGEVIESVIGAGAVVESGAVVEHSVLLPGVVVSAGAVVRDSMIGEGAVIGIGASLSALTVIGDRGQVGAGVALVAGRVPPG